MVDLAKGDAFGYYPEAAISEEIIRFEGTLFSPRGSLSSEWAGLAEDAVIRLARDIGGDLLILETGLSESDPARAPAARVQRSPTVMRAMLGTHLALWCSLHEGAFEDVARFLAAAGGYDNAFVVAGSDAVSQLTSDKVNGRLAALARSIRTLLVPAYDSESYLLWTRRVA